MKHILIIGFVIIALQVISVSASVKPIIVTEMPETINSGLQDLSLHWTIIDDNPRNYVITINNNTWKNESVHSNEIRVIFSNTYGWFNISLKVTDFSGNDAFSELYVNISSVFPITSTTTSVGSSSSSSYYNTNATPGFEYVILIQLFILISAKKLFKQKKSKRKSI